MDDDRRARIRRGKAAANAAAAGVATLLVVAVVDGVTGGWGSINWVLADGFAVLAAGATYLARRPRTSVR